MAKSSSPKRGEKSSKRALAVPAPLRRLRNAGLVAAWLAAVGCGWQAGTHGSWTAGGLGMSPGGPPPDLLAAALHGAGAWLGLTTLWLGGFNVCLRIIITEGAGIDGTN